MMLKSVWKLLPVNVFHSLSIYGDRQAVYKSFFTEIKA